MSQKSARFFFGGGGACFKKPTKIVKINNSLSNKWDFLAIFLHAMSSDMLLVLGGILQFELMRRMRVCESTSSMSSHLGRSAVSYQGLISQVFTSWLMDVLSSFIVVFQSRIKKEIQCFSSLFYLHELKTNSWWNVVAKGNSQRWISLKKKKQKQKQNLCTRDEEREKVTGREYRK